MRNSSTVLLFVLLFFSFHTSSCSCVSRNHCILNGPILEPHEMSALTLQPGQWDVSSGSLPDKPRDRNKHDILVSAELVDVGRGEKKEQLSGDFPPNHSKQKCKMFPNNLRDQQNMIEPT